MKKIWSLLIIMAFTFGLVACEKEDDIDKNDVPNGLKPLVVNKDCAVPTLEGGWVCTWSDEFSGEALNQENGWVVHVDNLGGYNNELQYYTNQNVEVSNGTLKLNGRKEVFGIGNGARNYTSGKIATNGKKEFLYGRFVVSAKAPAGKGTWPAAWMMPASDIYGTWPNSGEIDIMEYVGYMPDVAHTTIHTKKFNHRSGSQIGFTRTVPNLTTAFQTYEIIWKPGSIESYINGVLYGKFAYNPAVNQDVPYKDAFPFDHPFYFILNYAIGGDWGGSEGVNDDIFPNAFEIDYVRYYEQDYATYDRITPSAPTNIRKASILKNSIFWNVADDDFGIQYYDVYVDGVQHQVTKLNQTVLRNLTVGQSYEISVTAVDFTGKTSEKSETFTVTFE